MTSFDLETTYLGLDGRGRVTPIPVGPDFWKNIGTNQDAQGTLVTVSAGEGSWTSWEMHPEGDEVLVLLEGRLRMIFEDAGGGDKSFTLKPGSTLVVPAGTWHRAEDQQGARTLFMTFGAGTRHKPVKSA
jgi:mannose-6-phosphate isomerase-like protein (cupin superfamily)